MAGHENFSAAPIQTTDATPVVVVLRKLHPGEVFAGLFITVAKTAAGAVSVFRNFRTAQRIGSAGATLVGGALVGLPENTGVTWTCAIGVSGNAIIATLTGAAGTTITWVPGVMAVAN